VRAIESGSLQRAAGDALAPDAVVAVAAGDDHLHGALSLGVGCDRAVRALARLESGAIDVVAHAVGDAGMWFAELRRASDLVVVSAETGADDGPIRRLLMFAVPPADPVGIPHVDQVRIPRINDGRLPAVGGILERYFTALQQDRFHDAGAMFAADCVYSHPPYRLGTRRVEFRGPDALVRGWIHWIHERGSSTARQVGLRTAQNGPVAFVEGRVEGISPGGTFLSAVTLDPDGLIARYVACYAAPAVPAAVPVR
jgi:hypothetical protein